MVTGNGGVRRGLGFTDRLSLKKLNQMDYRPDGCSFAVDFQ